MSEPHYGELADRIYPGSQPIGISLRDWFAGQALAGMLCKAVHEDFDILAANSYAAADAMLAAREPNQ